MLSRFKNMPGVAWLVIGVCVTALVLPSTAYAVGALKWVGIEGANLNKANVTASGQLDTNGDVQGTSGNQADVTGNNELMTRNANPADIYQTPVAALSNQNVEQVLATPPANRGLLITDIHVNTNYVVPGNLTDVSFWVAPPSPATCTGSVWGYQLNPTSNGETDIPFAPGLPIPSGDTLCVAESGANNLGTDVSVTGESVPASELAHFNYPG